MGTGTRAVQFKNAVAKKQIQGNLIPSQATAEPQEAKGVCTGPHRTLRCTNLTYTERVMS